MWKQYAVALAVSLTVFCAAAVDVNKGSAQELTEVKGIGPAMSERIVEERKKGNFKNWDDFISRVRGVGSASAEKFSADGLTVQGKAIGAAASSKVGKDTKESRSKKGDKAAEKGSAKTGKKAADAGASKK